MILPRSRALIEAADSVPCTAEVILVCENLKTCYRVALAGWPGKKERHPLAAKTAMRLLQAILKDALDLAQIEVVVRDEPALTYKPLRYLNSPIMEQIEKGIRQRLQRPCRFWLPVRGLTEQ